MISTKESLSGSFKAIHCMGFILALVNEASILDFVLSRALEFLSPHRMHKCEKANAA